MTDRPVDDLPPGETVVDQRPLFTWWDALDPLTRLLFVVWFYSWALAFLMLAPW